MKVRCGGMVWQSIVFSFLALSLLGSLAVAQNFRGEIFGSVTDSTGAVVPGAQITAVATCVVASMTLTGVWVPHYTRDQITEIGSWEESGHRAYGCAMA